MKCQNIFQRALKKRCFSVQFTDEQMTSCYALMFLVFSLTPRAWWHVVLFPGKTRKQPMSLYKTSKPQMQRGE